MADANGATDAPDGECKGADAKAHPKPAEGEPKSTTASWLLPAVIAALVSGLVSLLPILFAGADAELQHKREVASVQREIVKEYRNYDVATADILLKHTLKPLFADKNQNAFQQFETDIGKLRTSGAEGSSTTAGAREFNVLIDPPTSAPSPVPSRDKLIAEFNSPNRLKYSDSLISSVGADSSALSAALVGALLSDSDPRSYRVNLYIALTLARIPTGWPSKSDPGNAVEKLKSSSNFGNATFRKRVLEAIDNRIS